MMFDKAILTVPAHSINKMLNQKIFDINYSSLASINLFFHQNIVPIEL